MPQVANPPMYGDFTGIFDFQTAQNAVIHAKQQFMELPAKLRARFDNSPQKLLEFLDDPENRNEAEFLGLVQAPDPDANAPKSDQNESSKEKQGEAPPKKTDKGRDRQSDGDLTNDTPPKK